MLKDADLNREYITTSEAAKRSGLSNIYLAQLLRQGKLEGFRVAREWLIYVDSLEKFLAMKMEAISITIYTSHSPRSSI